MDDISPIEEFRTALLRDTVRLAATDTLFYRELFGRVDLNAIRRVGDLPALPVVDKQILRNAGLRAVAGHRQFSHLQHTSGTTGEPFIVYRSIEEVQFIDRFFRAYLDLTPSDGTRPLQMSLQTPYHGTNTAVPTRSVVLNSANPAATAELLRKDFAIPGANSRVSMLTGPLQEVCKLTQYVRQARLTASDFRIASIHTTGDYQSRRMRKTLTAAWGAPVFDYFSLAEAFGGAIRCRTCDGFHFDPYVVPELVDLESGAVIDDGIGVLLLTCLHPFVQMQPLIRYRTGDIFSIERGTCPALSYHYLGRVEHSLFDPRNTQRLLLTSVDLFESLDDHSEIAHFLEQPLEPVVARAVVQPSGSSRVLTLRLCIGLYPGRCGSADAIKGLEAALQQELTSRSPALKSGLETRDICLEFEFDDARVLRETFSQVPDAFVLWEQAQVM